MTGMWHPDLSPSSFFLEGPDVRTKLPHGVNPPGENTVSNSNSTILHIRIHYINSYKFMQHFHLSPGEARGIIIDCPQIFMSIL